VSRTQSVWRDIRDDIVSKIISGVYEMGKRIPSMSQIASSYGVGRSTARNVLESLRADGVIYYITGVGYFVMPYVRDRLAAGLSDELGVRLADLVKFCISLGIDIEKLTGMLAAEYRRQQGRPRGEDEI